MMKRTAIPALLCGVFLLCGGCGEAPQNEYIPEATDAEETSEPTTEQPTLSSEELSGLLSTTAPTQPPAQTAPPASGTDASEPQADFGTAVYLGKLDDDSERFLFFYGDGSGSYLEQENGTGMGFTYEMNQTGQATFHIGDAESNTAAQIYWLDKETAEIFWESGAYEKITKLKYDPLAEFHFYNNQMLKERALQTYQKKNGSRPTDAVVMGNLDGTISIQLYDEIDGHTSTCDWYMIDRYTGIGTNLLDEKIDLSDAAFAPQPETTAPPQ